MRNKIKFSEIGSIYQEKLVRQGEKTKIFELDIPKNYIGFLYYMANNHFPLELNIDGEKMNINEIIAPIDSPKLFDPPFLVNKQIEVFVENKTGESKKIGFYADGVAYSILSPSEETFINEMKTTLRESKIGETDIHSSHTKTEEARPRFPHIMNYSIHEADKWYEIMLPKKGVKAWSLRCREEYDINYCFEPSKITYMTLPSGGTLSEDTAPQGVHAIYVRCSTANVTIELELWREEW